MNGTLPDRLITVPAGYTRWGRHESCHVVQAMCVGPVARLFGVGASMQLALKSCFKAVYRSIRPFQGQFKGGSRRADGRGPDCGGGAFLRG